MQRIADHEHNSTVRHEYAWGLAQLNREDCCHIAVRALHRALAWGYARHIRRVRSSESSRI